MAIIIAFFITHWFLSLFAQTFFLHRYAAHRMFRMSHGWERFWYLFTFVVQGSSFLNPRAYAVMHRMHHAYSDTEKDPHSPHYFRSVMAMMWRTATFYYGLRIREWGPGENFEKNVPEWKLLDYFADKWPTRVVWGTLYTLVYLQFATTWWLFLLLPIHYLMGPIHGSIVNWGGHKYGYRNFDDTKDRSRNTLAFDFLTMGELFQNNHHKLPFRPNFAVRWFELDPTYPFMWAMAKMRIIRFATVSERLSPLW